MNKVLGRLVECDVFVEQFGRIAMPIYGNVHDFMERIQNLMANKLESECYLKNLVAF